MLAIIRNLSVEHSTDSLGSKRFSVFCFVLFFFYVIARWSLFGCPKATSSPGPSPRSKWRHFERGEGPGDEVSAKVGANPLVPNFKFPTARKRKTLPTRGKTLGNRWV